MNTLRKRIDQIERNRPVLGLSAPLWLVGLAPDVLARVMQAKADGTFPQSLCAADLEELAALTDL